MSRAHIRTISKPACITEIGFKLKHQVAAYLSCHATRQNKTEVRLVLQHRVKQRLVAAALPLATISTPDDRRLGRPRRKNELREARTARYLAKRISVTLVRLGSNLSVRCVIDPYGSFQTLTPIDHFLPMLKHGANGWHRKTA